MRILLLALGLSVILGCGQKTSEEHMKTAQEFIEQKRLDSAVIELKNAIQLQPRNPAARFELGKVYLLKKDYESAEKELNRALEYGKPASDVIPLLSVAYQNTGAYAELSEIDHSDAGMEPEQELEVGFYKIQSLIQLAKNEEAKALIEELSGIQADTVYKGMIGAYSSLLNGNIEEAIEKTEALAVNDGENEDLLKLQGQLYLRVQNADAAADVYKKYLALYPEDTQITFVLANLLVDSGNVSEAEPYIDELLKINTENPLLNQLKSVARAADNDHDNAFKYAEKAINSGRSDPVLRLIAGYAAYALKDYESTNRHLSFIASSMPTDHPALKMLAASQLELGMSDEANDVLSKFEGESEQDAKLFSKAGYELIRSGNINEAKDVVERSAKLSRTAEDFTRLGILRLSLNDVSGIIDLEKALEQSPDLEVTKATLANAYLATNQLDKAQELAAEWISTTPEDFKGYVLAGEVDIKRGDFDAALTNFEKARSVSPENALIELAIANLDVQKGDLEQGEEKLLAIIKKKPDFVPALASYYLVNKRQGESEKGMQPALNAYRANNDRTDLSLLVARMQLADSKWVEVIDSLDGIEINDQTPPAYWSVKGKALLALGGVADAEAHHDAWLARLPNNKEANIGKMLLLDAKGEFDDGIELSRAFLDARDDAAVQILNVHFMTMAGQFENAKAALQLLPEKAKELPMVEGLHARILISEQKYDEALPKAQKAYENIPNSRNVVLLAINLERVNRAPAALALLEAHTQQFPNDLAAKMMLAERQISDDQSQAIATYERSLQLNPNNFIVLNNLAYLYTEVGRLEEAENYARQAVDQRPNNADAVDTLAQALMKQEKYDEALRFYDRVINDDMQNNIIYLNYVEVLFASGNTSLARRKLTERRFDNAELVQRIQDMKSQYGI